MAGKRTHVAKGTRYGRLVVLRDEGVDKWSRRRYMCRCDCGVEKVISWPHLRTRKTQSCGCLHADNMRARATHGWTRVKGDKYQRLMYVAWQGIKSRCRNPRAANYRWYGAKGVDICDAWHDSFVVFIEYVERELGRRPPGYSIDRVRPDGMYEPGNVRWSSPMAQRHNRRKLTTPAHATR